MAETLTPNLDRDFRQASDLNWAPLSVVTLAGMPNRDTQVSRNVCITVSAVVSAMGVASGQRVVLSTKVSRYLNPPVRREWAYDVDVDVFEPRRRYGDWLDRWFRMQCQFAPLSGLALPRPRQHLPAHVWPHVHLGHDGQGRLSRRVRQAVNRVKDRPPPGCGDEDARSAD